MIELVQKNKFLYDPRDPRYTKADIRVDTWAIIADHPTVKPRRWDDWWEGQG